jgi:hypothetical protein
MDLLFARGRAAIAEWAARSDDAAIASKTAADAIRQLEKERPPVGRVFAALLGAGVASVSGDEAVQKAILRDAMDRCEELEMALHYNCAKHRLGGVRGDTEGSSMIAEAELWMRDQDVINPRRLVATHIPGRFAPASKEGR